MKSELLSDWYNSRVMQLRHLSLTALVEYARELGWTKMDPGEDFSYATWIADTELRRLRAELGAEGPDGYPAADVTGVPWEIANPEDIKMTWEETDEWLSEAGVSADSINRAERKRARTDEEIANNYHPVPGAVLDDPEEEEEPPHLDKMRKALLEDAGEQIQAIERMQAMVLDEYPDKPQSLSLLLNVDPRLIQTVSADSIVNLELPQLLQHFLRKNAEYGDRHRRSRGGIKGETVNLDRKIDKVWEALWEGKLMEFEQPRELIWDLIGSCFLMLDLISLSESRAIVADATEEEDEETPAQKWSNAIERELANRPVRKGTEPKAF